MDTQQHDSLFLSGKDNDKGGYGLVTSAADDEETDYDGEGPSKISMQALEMGNEEGHDMPMNESAEHPWQRIMFTPLLPDDRLYFFGVQLMDGVEGVRLFKFFATTWIGLIGMFYFIRWMVSTITVFGPFSILYSTRMGRPKHSFLPGHGK